MSHIVLSKRFVAFFLRTLLKTLIGSGGMKVHEEAWNAYPYCKTVITNPGYLKDDFKIVFETLHVDNDAGFTDNVLGTEVGRLEWSEMQLI